MVIEYSEFNVDDLHQCLLSISFKWKKLGLALSLDEEQTLSNIASTYQTDEECLEGLLKLPNLKNSLLMDIIAALRDIGEDDLATKLDFSELKLCIRFRT